MAFVMAMAIAALSWFGASAHARYDESRFEPLKRLSIQELYEKGWASEDPDSTMICLTVALNKYREHPSEKDRVCYVRALNAIASTYLVKFNDFYEAYYYFLEAKKEADALGNPRLEAMLDYNMACVYTSIREIDRAISNYYAALDVSSANKDWNVYQAAFSGLVLNAVAEGRLESMDRELSRFPSLHIPDTTMSAYTRCLYEGGRSLRAGDYDGAVRSFEESYSHIDAPFATEMYRDFPSILTANAYILKGDTARAITIIKDNFDRYSPDNRAETCRLLAELYRQTERKDSAEHYMLAYYREAEACGALKRQEFKDALQSIGARLQEVLNAINAELNATWEEGVYEPRSKPI